MRRFDHLNAVAAVLPIENIDTDKILPGEYLKTISRAGLGKALFARLRYDAGGQESPAFVLNNQPWREAKILIAGENFGCGSSREHAPWALIDFGISCIIAPSFADIFYNNCFKNGILPIVLSPQCVVELSALAVDPDTCRLDIDLPSQWIMTCSGQRVDFQVQPGHKTALIEGRDEIAETLAHENALDAWEARTAARYPNTSLVMQS